MPSTPEYAINASSLFDLSADLLCFLGSDGYFIKVNSAFCQVLGYTERELLSKEFLEFVHPEDKPGTLEQLELLVKNKTIFDFKNRYRCVDGSYRWFSWNASLLTDNTCYASARDITAYQLTQQTLEKNIDAHQKVLFNFSILIITNLLFSFRKP